MHTDIHMYTLARCGLWYWVYAFVQKNAQDTSFFSEILQSETCRGRRPMLTDYSYGRSEWSDTVGAPGRKQ